MKVILMSTVLKHEGREQLLASKAKTQRVPVSFVTVPVQCILQLRFDQDVREELEEAHRAR